MEIFVLNVQNAIPVWPVNMERENMSVWNVMETHYVATNDTSPNVQCALLSINPFNVRFMKGF